MSHFWFAGKGKGSIPAVASWRGIAAFLIFIFHFWGFFLQGESSKKIGWGIFDFTPFFKAGHVALDFFFVLSGLLLFVSISRKSFGAKSLAPVFKSFLNKRFVRLWPLAAFFTVLIFLLRGPDFFLSRIGWANLLAHLTFTQSFFQQTYWGLNPVMWTLTVEMLFILVLPLVIFAGRNSRRTFLQILLALCVANFLFRAFVFQFFENLLPLEKVFFSEQLWGRFDQFALGILLGVFFAAGGQEKFARKKNLQIFARVALFAGFVGMTLLIAFFARVGSNFRDSIFLQTFLHFFVALAFTIFLFGFACAGNFPGKDLLAPKGFALFGRVSFSFFLWHFPVLSFFHKMHIAPWPAFVGSFLVSLALSLVTAFLIENLLAAKMLQKRKT